MSRSEFDEAYEDDTSHREREEQRLGEAILNAPIRALDPRPAVCLPGSASVGEAVRRMLAQQVGAVLVSSDGRPAGIFTERDVLRHLATAGADTARPVSEVMTPDPECLGFEDGVAYALNRMVEGGYRNIPIVDDAGKAVALLSLRDVVAFIVSLLPARVLNLPPDPRHEARSEDGG